MSSLDNLASFSDVVMSLRMDADWSYDPVSGRYRSENGRFLDRKAVEALIDGRVGKLSTQLKDYTRRLSDGFITIDQWQGSVREAIKMAHIQAAVLGQGGRDALSASDYGRIGQKLRQEYRYLERFVRDLLDGSVSSAHAANRIGLYAESVRSSYWEGTTVRQGQQGYSLMRRILDGQAQHCQDCIGYAQRGIVPIGSLPMPGQRCECRARCKCSIEYLRQQAPTVLV
jgi:hypothetical protein